MKKIILLVFTTLMMAGCGTSIERDTELCSKKYHTIIIDSCEYLSHDKLWDITHKGNCRFCKERDSIKWKKHKKELEELSIKLKKK